MLYACNRVFFCLVVEGKDVLIISEDQDRFVVVAGTFKKLVEQLACEEKPGISTIPYLLNHNYFWVLLFY